ncbi:MAG TPA: GNAT family N-acetyltransferase [Actinomycetota bacterium]|nr:GNAT family N-acetyltransferase [Actinomycetota bacterium]
MGDGVQVRRLRPEEWPHLKALRLAALAEAPHAFGSTLQHEEAFSDARWQEVARGTIFVAVSDGDWVGMAGGYRHDVPGLVRVWGMWVHPDQRRLGLGRALLEAVVAWARMQNADRIRLGVSESNRPAYELYRAEGFMPTGQRQPLRSDPSIIEIELERRI